MTHYISLGASGGVIHIGDLNLAHKVVRVRKNGGNSGQLEGPEGGRLVQHEDNIAGSEVVRGGFPLRLSVLGLGEH